MELLYGSSFLYAAGRYLPKRYVLRGDLSLTYEKKWVEQTDTDAESERFTHNYNLGLSGFVVDPRLMTFDIDGTFSEEKNFPGDTLNSYGVNTALNILNKPARRGFFSHFPQPIVVTLGYLDTGATNLSNYGISFGYDAFERMRIHRQFQQQQQQQQFRRQQQIMQQVNENNAQQNQGVVQGQNNAKIKSRILPLPLPVMYFDYNNYRHKFNGHSSSFNTDSEFMNIRLVDRSDKMEYHVQYSYDRTEGATVTESQRINTEMNYRDYWAEKKERLESYNSLDLSDDDDRRSLKLSSNTLWEKQLGKEDTLNISGGGSYFTSDNEDSAENYELTARSEYTKNFVKILNRLNADLKYGDSGTDEIYLLSLSNDTNYDHSRRLSLNLRENIGRNELGESYGAGVGLQVWTGISISPRYDFHRSAASEGKTITHHFDLDMAGRILRDLTFNSRNALKFEEVRGSSPSKEKILDLRLDFFWALQLMDINFGASRVETKTSEVVDSGSEQVDIMLTSVYSNLSVPLKRNMHLTLNSSYTSDRRVKTFVFNPIFAWYLRQITFNAEYELIKPFGVNEAVDHRVYFRLTRSFAKRLRNWW